MGLKPKNIVITGSTRGIGFGLASRFLERGCAVTINGTSMERIQEAVDRLTGIFSNDKIQGVLADMREPFEIEQLWNRAKSKFGPVDIWINNAGINQPRQFCWEIGTEEIRKIFNINLLGVVTCSNLAFRYMKEQGFGAIYNIEGFGSNGMTKEMMTIYGTTKAALTYFTESMAKEASFSPIIIGLLNPEMVFTDFLKKFLPKDPAEAKRTKKIYKILSDNVDTVTKYLADEVLKNKTHGKRITWLSKRKAMARFLSVMFKRKSYFERKSKGNFQNFDDFLNQDDYPIL